MIHKIRTAIKNKLRPGTFLRTMAESSQRYLWKHAPRFFAWRPERSLIQIEITSRCNLSCWNCDRVVGRAPSDDYMSVEQIKRFVKESIDSRWRWCKISLIGGEPTLHPEFDDILSALKSYKMRVPECEILIMTNGYGKHVRDTLAHLPDWVMVENSEKKSSYNSFQSYNVAPIDMEQYQNDDFSRGCFITEFCGLALTRYGYYSCGPGASVDRVFGFDMGIKSLSALTDAVLKDQLSRLCGYCGHYKYNYKEAWISTEEISQSWQDALERYQKKRPGLTLY